MAKEKGKKEKSKHPLRDNIEVIVFAVAMSLGLKVFALEAYQIPTGSMQPTLMGTQLRDGQGAVNDRVLVDKFSYLVRDPERWEVVVFRYPLSVTQNYVKRLVGLPGEELEICHGDLWARPLGSEEDMTILQKPWNVQEHLWKRVLPRPGSNPFQWNGWRISGDHIPAGDGPLQLTGKSTVSLRTPVRDEYRDGYPDAIFSSIPVQGSGANSHRAVSDLRLTCTATASANANPLVIQLDAGAFPITLSLLSDGAKLALPNGTTESIHFATKANEAIDIDLAFWDHQVRLILTSDSQETVYSSSLSLEANGSPRNSVSFKTDGGWSLNPASLSRDIHYLPPFSGATPRFEIAEGHYFMMGDNTQNSLDGRDWEARVFRFDPPLADGSSEVRGDHLQHGSDPFYDNPRWSANREFLTHRDEWGNLHQFSRADLTHGQDLRVSAPTVPRHYILGKALAVFLPIPPFAPVWRIGWVH